MPDIVLPGDIIATEEEAVPSDGTYLEDSNIYSLLTGVAKTSSSKAYVGGKLRDVQPFKSRMSVIGEVEENMRTVLFVKIAEQFINPVKYVALKSGKIVAKPGMLELPRAGDIVLAYIYASMKDNYVLDMRADEYGIVYAKCPYCDAELANPSKNVLECKSCKLTERKKVSLLYNNAAAIEQFLAKNNSVSQWKHQ